MKKLFVVEMMTEVIVLAENKAAAEELARKERRNIISEEFDYHASPMTYFPADWEDDSTPYGADKSLGKLIEEGAAPELLAHQNALAEKAK